MIPTQRGIFYKGYSIVRSFSLVSRHAEFLSLVKGHGSGDVLLERTARPEIVVLKLANPSRKNAMSGRMMFQLANIVDTIVHMDDSVVTNDERPTGLIVTGEGNIFCAGADFGLAKEVLVTPQLGRAMSLFMTDALNSLRNSNLVSVCLLNGPAVGGGAELSTCTDFRLMAPNAFCRFIHARMGVSPGWGGISRLHSILGRTNTLKLLGTSLPLPAADAVALGYASAVVQDHAIESAIQFLMPFTVDQPFPDAIRCIKRAVVAADSCAPEEARAVELDMFSRCWQSDDNQKALSSK
jgi:ethylmalonyl-CoA/methylmalonyl-CoA decarboxylase